MRGQYFILLFSLYCVFLLVGGDVSAGACVNVPVSGDYTVQCADSSCYFNGTIDGVDAGKLTVPADKTLLIGNIANHTIAFTTLQIVKRGSVAINKGQGASLKKARIWVYDIDDDKYPSSSAYQAQSESPGSGWRYRGTLTGTFTYTSDIVTDANDNFSCTTGYAEVTGCGNSTPCSGCVDGACVNLNNIRDTFGSNTCQAACKKCIAGSCGNQAEGEDIGDLCPAQTCGIVVNSATGSTCFQVCAQQQYRPGTCAADGICASTPCSCYSTGLNAAANDGLYFTLKEGGYSAGCTDPRWTCGVNLGWCATYMGAETCPGTPTPTCAGYRVAWTKCKCI